MTKKELAAKQDGQDQEPLLPLPEVSRTAHALIGEFKQAMRHTPVFALALQDQYFSEEPKKKSRDPVKFRKGDYCYRVQYTIDSEREKLLVSKLPADPEGKDWTDETITLEAFTDMFKHQFTFGVIQSAKYFKEKKPNLFTNTNTAIQKVQEFALTNF